MAKWSGWVHLVGCVFLWDKSQELVTKKEKLSTLFSIKCEWNLSAFHTLAKSIYCTSIVFLMNPLLAGFNRKVMKIRPENRFACVSSAAWKFLTIHNIFKTLYCSLFPSLWNSLLSILPREVPLLHIKFMKSIERIHCPACSRIVVSRICSWSIINLYLTFCFS